MGKDLIINNTGNGVSGQPDQNVVVPDSLLYPLMISCVVAVLENLSVCVLIAINRTLRTATNTFVFSLCIADICFAGLILPIHCFYSNSIVYEYLVLISILTYILNLTSVTYERLVSLTNPLRYHAIITKKFALKIILVAWAIPLPYCLLPAIWNGDKRTLAHKIYMTCTLVIFLLAPLVFILFVYGRIFVEIRKLYDHRKQLVIRPQKVKSRKANRLVNALSNELARSGQLEGGRKKKKRKFRMRLKMPKTSRNYDCMHLVNSSMSSSRDRVRDSHTEIEEQDFRDRSTMASPCCIANSAILVRYEHHSQSYTGGNDKDTSCGCMVSMDSARKSSLPTAIHNVIEFSSGVSESIQEHANEEHTNNVSRPCKTIDRYDGVSEGDGTRGHQNRGKGSGKQLANSQSLPELSSSNGCISNVTSCSMDVILKSKTAQASSLQDMNSNSLSSCQTDNGTTEKEILSGNKCLEDICLTALAVSKIGCTCMSNTCTCLDCNDNPSSTHKFFDAASLSKTLNGVPNNSTSEITAGQRICGCDSKVFSMRQEFFSAHEHDALLMPSTQTEKGDNMSPLNIVPHSMPFGAPGCRQVMSSSEQQLLSSESRMLNHDQVSDSAGSTSPSDRFLSNPNTNFPNEVSSRENSGELLPHISEANYDSASNFSHGRRRICCPLSQLKEHFKRRGKHASKLSILSEEKRRKSHADKFKTVLAELKSSLAFAAVAFTYMFTWIPVGYMTFLDVIDRLDLVPTVLSEVSVFTIALNAVIDPLLYALLLRDFKKYSRKLLRRLCGTQQRYKGW